jgi:alkanesulfonate monooxygenase SsuD/methylene tetrahydromethanopterin reductase-like flavin-dependent oxidoreductase (luciferase family)
MSSRRLADQLAEHYARQALDPEALDRLRGVVLEARARRGRRTRRWTLALAACVVLAVSLTLLVRLDGQAEALAERAAREVAGNHRKALPSDVVTGSERDVRERMTHLDFELRLPRRLGSELRLVGGRYCSIQSQAAAQLHLLDDAGRRHTLYATRATEALSPFVDTDVDCDGVRVVTWQEGEVLYSLASPGASPQADQESRP